jgi:SAM-dependent methyltransferase
MANPESHLRLQIEEHPLIRDRDFHTVEQYVPHLMHIRAYEEAARFVKGKDVLDLGCNNGYGLKILQPFARTIAGLDVSPQAVEAARQEFGRSADIRIYDGNRSSFPAEQFEVVVSFQVIEHVADLGPYLTEMKRLLKSEGVAILTTPNAALRLDPGMRPWNRFHFHEFRPDELATLLSEWFGHVEVKGMFGTDELHAIEACRVERAKSGSRYPAKTLRVLRRSLGRVLGERGRVWVRRMRQPKSPTSLDPTVLERFSTKDLTYRSEQIDEALDLMAICRK